MHSYNFYLILEYFSFLYVIIAKEEKRRYMDIDMYREGVSVF
jgi:hypothetical protein